MSELAPNPICPERTWATDPSEHQCELFRDHVGPHCCSCSVQWETTQVVADLQGGAS